MKLPNMYGTVYKLQGNRRRPWIAKVPTHRVDGILKYTILGYFEDQASALNALADYHKNRIPINENITLGELYKEWSDVKYEEDISEDTIYGYKAAWKHINIYKDEVFKNIRTSHWQKIINNLRNQNFSYSTMHKVKLLIGLLYEYAIDNRITDKNLGKKIKLKKLDSKEKETFTDLEIKIIEKAAEEGDVWAGTIMILLYTGFRISEFLHLTKFSVNLKDNVVIGGEKTEAGKDRIVPIHPKILPYIQYWYNRNGERLICNDNGKQISDRKYREDLYRPTLEKLGVRLLDPHHCRHTFATRLSKAGANIKAIQNLMGHADYSTTANIYTHTDLDELRKAINKI